ncbi:MAG: MEKHLA domain-containing protein [Methylococcales bacterium]|nr:MEKHLA domain-containing protein [Methylococcales bacterium]
MQFPTAQNNFLLEHALLLSSSYNRLLRKDLISHSKSDSELGEQLFHAPFALVSHNTDSNPIFNYTNLKALELFELNWEAFTQLPSKLSAEPVNQTERERLLAQVTQKGYIDNYAGIRISSSGQRFMIKNAVVWNLHDDKGNYKGQAACFADWEFI